MSDKKASVEQLKELVKEFPQTAGVYLMKNMQDKIIYVGKAKSLRHRVRSYFSEAKDVAPKTKFLVNQIHKIDYVLTKTEVEAFLLEASLIKKYRPRYNIRLKDDKAYPYIRLSMADAFPRLYLARKVAKDGSIFFGPYTSGAAVRETIRFLNATFKIRDCKDAFMRARKRPCLTYEIGRCTAPCVKLVSQKDYGKDLEAALAFLKGDNKKVIRDLKGKMLKSSQEERFEQAAKYRDSLAAIEAILEKQAVIRAMDEHDVDVFSYFGNEKGCLILSLHIRKGRVIGHRSQFLARLNPQDPGEDIRDWLVSYLNQYYDDNFVPDEVLLPHDLGGDLNKLMSAVLQERSGHKVKVHFPSGQDAHRLLEMAAENAKSQFHEKLAKSERANMGLEEIQKKFHLSRLPHKIECFDISNFQGSLNVASQVVFEDGEPNKDLYRRYKIKGFEGANDFASMKEVLSRRFQHSEWEEPDLILVDGGKGQLSMAVAALKEVGKEGIPIASIAKSRTQGSFSDSEVLSTEERFFLPGRQNPVVFRTNSDALKILVQLRDEAHRFAIEFHRNLRDKSLTTSILDKIEGIGEAKRKLLQKSFPDLQALANASVEELTALPGIHRELAERILQTLKEEMSSEESEPGAETESENEKSTD